MTSFEQEIQNKRLEEEDQKKERDVQSRFFNALNQVAETHEGRIVLKTILNLYPLEQDTFSSDALLMAYNTGRKSIALDIRNLVIAHLGKSKIIDIDNEVL